jgi:AcrR family transcriptional regulator
MVVVMRFGSSSVTVPSSDGRRRRSEKSRDAIVEAMMALVEAGAITPSAEEVATKAEVGLRSVFRHFKDMESLYAEMAMRVVGSFEQSLAPFQASGWRAQIDEAIDRRIALYDRLLPFKRAADVHRHESPAIQANHVATQKLLRYRLQSLLPESLGDDGMTLDALDLMLSFEVWQRLRVDQSLDTEAARVMVKALVARLIDKN